MEDFDTDLKEHCRKLVYRADVAQAMRDAGLHVEWDNSLQTRIKVGISKSRKD